MYTLAQPCLAARSSRVDQRLGGGRCRGRRFGARQAGVVGLWEGLPMPVTFRCGGGGCQRHRRRGAGRDSPARPQPSVTRGLGLLTTCQEPRIVCCKRWLPSQSPLKVRGAFTALAKPAVCGRSGKFVEWLPRQQAPNSPQGCRPSMTLHVPILPPWPQYHVQRLCLLMPAFIISCIVSHNQLLLQHGSQARISLSRPRRWLA